MLRRILLSFGALLLLISLSTTADERTLPQHWESLPDISSNGLLLTDARSGPEEIASENGRYHATFTIMEVGDEVRRIGGFGLNKDGKSISFWEKVPGSDAVISNSGIVAFFDHKRHFARELIVHFFSPSGHFLAVREFRGAHLFGFSPSGQLFGVGTSDRFEILNLEKGSSATYPPALRFCISDNDQIVVFATEEEITVYDEEGILLTRATPSPYIRKVDIDGGNTAIGAIYKNFLDIYEVPSGKLTARYKSRPGESYRDIFVADDRIVVGIQRREPDRTTGIRQVYDTRGRLLDSRERKTRRLPVFAHSPERNVAREQAEIPWPFAPFDSVHTVWNYYEQHMGGWGSSYSYLHQGLDIITPVAEPTYAVEAGIVKCVLTLGGELYWRIAISEEQIEEQSEGWLYAHLIEESIQVDVGDTVAVHDYIGDIIHWAEDWGHIHFVKIKDSGLIWQYDDDEWGIVFNPLMALRPDTDDVPPAIEPVFETSLFGICENETSNYLTPDSLHGDVDFIVKVQDYVGDSPWVQPAFRAYYWVTDAVTSREVFPKTMGHILNHEYDFYEGGNYEPYATLLYKRDELLVPSSWMSQDRNFYHILTNNDGDSLATLDEKSFAFPTASFPDGKYYLHVQVFDEFGNATEDSMSMAFHNGLIAESTSRPNPTRPTLDGVYPLPVTDIARIRFSVPGSDFTTLRLYDLNGRIQKLLVQENLHKGPHELRTDMSDVPAGIYLCVLSQGDSRDTRTVTIVR